MPRDAKLLRLIGVVFLVCKIMILMAEHSNLTVNSERNAIAEKIVRAIIVIVCNLQTSVLANVELSFV